MATLRAPSGTGRRPGRGRRSGRVREAAEARLTDLFGEPDDSSLPLPGWSNQPSPEPDRSSMAGNAPAGHRRRRTTWRIDPGRRAAAAMVAVVVVTAALVGARMLATRPRAEAVPGGASIVLPAGSAPGASVTPGTSTATGRSSSAGVGPSAALSGAAAPLSGVVVDVVGRVHRPGLVRLPAGARVDDAIRAAGGVRAGTNLSGINLARVCVDGEQISVGVAGAAPPPAVAGTGSSTGPPAALVNLNSGTLEQLDTLPGVGPVMAQRIVDWRTTHGPFASVDQLRQVSGIGDVTFARLGPLVTV